MSMIKQEKSRQESFKIVFDAVMQHVPHDEEVLEALHQLGTESTSKFRFLDALEERFADPPLSIVAKLKEEEINELTARLKSKQERKAA